MRQTEWKIRNREKGGFSIFVGMFASPLPILGIVLVVWLVLVGIVIPIVAAATLGAQNSANIDKIGNDTKKDEST